MEEQVLETGGEAEREEHRDSSVDIKKKTNSNWICFRYDLMLLTAWMKICIRI
jgi:hypothetical protein